MEIVGFIGASGTGKSHHALVVAYEQHMEAIIDDGLLIYRNRIVAGKSAKDEPDRMKAVRCAVFVDAREAGRMREAIARIGVQKLLILGTSRHMVERICEALELPRPRTYIPIEAVSAPEEIAKAQDIRLREGKHIIPVPTMELRSHFRGYLLQPLRSFFLGPERKQKEFERSVVRPIFSYYGKLIFANHVVVSLIRHGIEPLTGVARLHDVSVKRRDETRQNGLAVTLSLSVRYGTDIQRLMSRIKKTIQDDIEYTTGMSVDMLKITVRQVVAK